MRASTRAPSAMWRTPRVPWGWRRRSVGEPGLKIRRAPSASSSGMCEWPKMTSRALGNLIPHPAQPAGRGAAVVDHRDRQALRGERGRLGRAPGGDVGAVVVADDGGHRRVLGQLVEHGGRADVARVQDQVRVAELGRDRGRAGLPAPGSVRVGQHDDPHHGGALPSCASHSAGRINVLVTVVGTARQMRALGSRIVLFVFRRPPGGARAMTETADDQPWDPDPGIDVSVW